MKSTFKLLALAWLSHALVSHAPAQVVSGTPSVGNRQRIIYLDSGNSNRLVSLVANLRNNETIILGPGVFTVTSILDMVNGGSIKGAGMLLTKINGVSDLLWPSTNTVLMDLTLEADFPMTLFYEATNIFCQNVWFKGKDDAVFSSGNDTVGQHLRLKGCWLWSSADFIMMQYTAPNRNVEVIVEDSWFHGDPFRFGTINPARELHFFSGSTGRLFVNNCRFTFTNCMEANIYNFADGQAADKGLEAVFSNISYAGAVTNGGIVRPFRWTSNSGGTNCFLTFQNTPQIPITTNAAIVTNQAHGPIISIMTSAVARTNWLPDIAFLGLERYQFEITVKDGNGNAAAQNISVRPSGGQTIDGAAAVTINANYGSVTVAPRAGTTNWMVLSRGQ